MSRTISKDAIYFIHPDTLISTVKNIETTLPGWWWSISQRSNLLGISIGPGSNCPNLLDREFLKTPVGDKGLIYSRPFNDNMLDVEVSDWVSGLVENAISYRDILQEDHPDIPKEKINSVYRYQNETALKLLEQYYQRFFTALPIIENAGYVVKELYLGSCDLSADCSIRGTNTVGKEFDISVDLIGKNETIAEALMFSIDEVKSDVLTPRT